MLLIEKKIKTIPYIGEIFDIGGGIMKHFKTTVIFALLANWFCMGGCAESGGVSSSPLGDTSNPVGPSDVDADTDVDTDTDADSDVDTDTDADTDTDVDTDTDAEITCFK